MNEPLQKSPPPSSELTASEGRMSLLINAVTEYAIFMLSPTGIINTWNQGAQRIKLYSASEIIGKHFSVFYPPEEIALGKPARELKTAIEKGQFVEEGWRLRKDGSRFWASVTLTPIYDDARVLQGFVKITRDFTERRQMEEALRQSEERFRLLVQSVKDYAIFMLDPEGRVNSWNEGAERAKGYKAEEILGRSFTCFYPPEDLASGKPQELLRIAAEQGRVEVEGWRIRKDGSRFWADVILSAIRDANGKLLGFTKVTRDMTAKKVAEDTVRSKQMEITQLQKMESIGRLAGGIAHDFNNILAGILGCAEEIELEVQENPLLAKEASGEIRKACDRGRALVRQLMAFSRRQMATPKKVDLNDILRNMTDLIERSVTGSSIKLHLALDPTPVWIEADVSQMEQIIMNLAINARDAMPEGGQLSIRTQTLTIDDYMPVEGFPERPTRAAQLTVSDSGIGIPKDIQSKIFEPFFTTKPQGQGTGLGLSTVYGIVQQNKGVISVYSELGMGTVFHVFLPSADQSGGDVIHPGALRDSQTAPTGNDLILVVDDDPLVLRGAVRNLQYRGYAVLGASTAAEAKTVFAKARGNVRLLLTDIMMPDQNGKELADFLQSEDAKLKVLFMSGYQAETIAEHGIVHGGVDFIEKPFTGEEIARKVRAILDRPASA